MPVKTEVSNYTPIQLFFYKLIIFITNFKYWSHATDHEACCNSSNFRVTRKLVHHKNVCGENYLVFRVYRHLTTYLVWTTRSADLIGVIRFHPSDSHLKGKFQKCETQYNRNFNLSNCQMNHFRN